MKILVLVHEIGTSASGIVSQRVIEELIRQGHDLRIITSRTSVSYDTAKVISCNDILRTDSILKKIYTKLILLLGADKFNANYFWRFRAYIQAIKYIKQWRPDFIYCRTSPIDPCFVGLRLKKQFNIPLVVNLTDPLPAPVEYLPRGKIRTNRTKAARSIIKDADLVSMGTQQAIEYQIRESGIDFTNKSFISPDPVPANVICRLNKVSLPYLNLVYLGAVYGSRNILPLIDAIKKINQNGFSVKLKIYGNYPSTIKDGFVERCAYEHNVDMALAEADILIDIDGDDAVPMFVSSKLKQYLVVDRPILSITPSNSPSSILLNGLKSAYVVRNQWASIYEVIMHIVETCREYTYEDRQELIQQFSAQSVVLELVNRVSPLLKDLTNE